MSKLAHRQEKIQSVKSKNTFRDFLREIASWYPLVLYKNRGLTSLYPENDRSVPVITHKEFEKSIPGLVEGGFEYNSSLGFFENFQTLLLRTPFSALYNYSGAENSDFSFSVLNSKNCYLSFTVITDCENIVTSFAVKEGCRNIFSSVQVSNSSENVWRSVCVIKGFNIFYSKFIDNSADLWFSSNMRGCHECLLCDGLENKKYCIQNIQYTKSDYFKKKHELLFQREKYEDWYMTLTQKGENVGSKHIKNGNFVLHSEDVENGMYSFRLKQARNTLIVGSPHMNQHISDAFEAGSLGNIHMYGVMNTGVNSDHIYNSEGIVTCHNVYYSRFLENCTHCLGCIGLRNQRYCILNKQYSKNEWFDMVEKIFSRMEKEGNLGSYFPGKLNPFYFNDSVASLVGDFAKEEVLESGYLRREKEIAVDIPEWMDVVLIGNLGEYESNKEGERYIDPIVLKKVIKDEQGNVYRVIKMEYDFLMKYKLPLPRKHRLDRLKESLRGGNK